MLRAGKDRTYPYILLFAAAVVHTVGLVLKPKQPEEKSPPSENELAQLERLTQQRRLRELSSYLTDAAYGTAASLVLLRPGDRSGILWKSRDLVVTTKAAEPDLDQPSTMVTPEGRSLPVHAVPVPPGALFSAFSFTRAPRTTSSNRQTTPSLGDWILAVAKNR